MCIVEECSFQKHESEFLFLFELFFRNNLDLIYIDDLKCHARFSPLEKYDGFSPPSFYILKHQGSSSEKSFWVNGIPTYRANPRA